MKGRDQVISRRPIQIVRISPKNDMDGDLVANHVQVLDWCRRTVLVSVHQLKQYSIINIPKQKRQVLTYSLLVASACQCNAMEGRNLVGVGWMIP